MAKGAALLAADTRLRLDHLDPAIVRFEDVDGTRTRYVIAGDGEPLVLLHGGQFGSLYALDAWSLNLGPLAAEFQVIALDRLGQGFTDNPSTDDGYRMRPAIDHVWGLLDAIGIDRFHLVGHSRGGLVAAHMAVTQPDRVRSLVIVDSHTAAPPDTDAEFPPGVFYTSFVVPRADPPTLAGVRAEPEAQAWDPSHITPDFEARLLELARLPKVKAAQAAMQREQRRWLDSVDEIRREVTAVIDSRGFQAPVLVMWAMNDRSAPARLGLRLFERIAATTRHVELRLVREAGHYVFREAADAFERTLIDFCRASPGRRSAVTTAERSRR